MIRRVSAKQLVRIVAEATKSAVSVDDCVAQAKNLLSDPQPEGFDDLRKLLRRAVNYMRRQNVNDYRFALQALEDIIDDVGTAAEYIDDDAQSGDDAIENLKSWISRYADSSVIAAAPLSS